jgi:hypothetical protein
VGLGRRSPSPGSGFQASAPGSGVPLAGSALPVRRSVVWWREAATTEWWGSLRATAVRIYGAWRWQWCSTRRRRRGGVAGPGFAGRAPMTPWRCRPAVAWRWHPWWRGWRCQAGLVVAALPSMMLSPAVLGPDRLRWRRERPNGGSSTRRLLEAPCGVVEAGLAWRGLGRWWAGRLGLLLIPTLFSLSAAFPLPRTGFPWRSWPVLLASGRLCRF